MQNQIKIRGGKNPLKLKQSLLVLALVSAVILGHPAKAYAGTATKKTQTTVSKTKATATKPSKEVSKEVVAASKRTGRIIATGPVTGIYFPAGGAIQRLASSGENKTNFNIWASSTEGSFDNLQGLRSGKYDYAVVQSDWQYYAFKGEGVFKTAEPFDNLRAVASLYVEPLTILVREGAEIYSFSDLKGHDVSFGAPGTSTRMLMEKVTAAFGFDIQKDFEVSNVTLTEAAEALCSGQVDALAFAAAHPNGMIQEVANKCQVMMLPVGGEPAKSLLHDNPFLTSTVIPGGLYPGMDNDTDTIGFTAILVTMKDEPEEEVYQLTRALFSNVKLFKAQHPVFGLTTAKNMRHAGIAIPFHSGAERYFREAKIN